MLKFSKPIFVSFSKIRRQDYSRTYTQHSVRIFFIFFVNFTIFSQNFSQKSGVEDFSFVICNAVEKFCSIQRFFRNFQSDFFQSDRKWIQTLFSARLGLDSVSYKIQVWAIFRTVNFNTEFSMALQITSNGFTKLRAYKGF